MENTASFFFNLIRNYSIPLTFIIFFGTWVALVLLARKPVTSAYTRLNQLLEGDLVWRGRRIPRLSLLLVLTGVSYFLLIITLNLLHFLSFQLGLYDFGDYGHMLWRVATFKSPEIAFLQVPHWLGDHFQPILYLFIPFVRLIGPVATMLILEPLAIVLGLIPLSLLCRRYQLSSVITLFLAGGYLLFPGTVNALLFPFHPSTLLPVFFLTLVAAYEYRRWSWYWVSLLLALMLKENCGLYFAFVGLWQIIARRDWRVGVPTLVLSLGWSLVAIGVIIPALRHGPYPNSHLALVLYQDGSLWQTLLHHPQAFLAVFVDSTAKQQLLISQFLFFSLLPLFNVSGFMMAPHLLERFASDNPTRLVQGYHYGIAVVPVLLYSSIVSLHKIRARRPNLLPLISIVLLVSFVTTSLLTSYNQINFTESMKLLRERNTPCIRAGLHKIPRDSSVIAQNGLIPFLSQSAKLSSLNKFRDDFGHFDYVIIDRDVIGDPLNSSEDLRTAYRNIASDGRYGLIYSCDSVAVWKLGAISTAPLSPELTSFLQSN